MNNILQVFNQFMTNPMGFLLRKFSIPQNVNANDPQSIVQYLLNTGQITQDQVNNAVNMRNTPMFKQFFGR